MCSSIKEFDVHARGVVNLIETWKKERTAVRAAWKLDDLTCEWLKLAEGAHGLRKHYCEKGGVPNSATTYSYFIDILDDGVRCGRELDDLIGMFEAEGYSVERSDQLRREMDRLRAVIDEDRFATNASFDSGALSDWD